MNYIDLKISIRLVGEQTYQIDFSSAGGRETSEKSTFPFEADQLADWLEKISAALYTTGTRFMGRRPEEEEATVFSAQDIEEFGKSLFNFLFVKENLAHYRSLTTQSFALINEGVRLKLHFNSDALFLSNIPWELTRDTSQRGDFLVLDNRTPLVRYINLDQAVQTFASTDRLNILGMISNPLLDLDVAKEKKWVEESLQDLVETGRVHLDWVDGEEFTDIQSAIRTGDWHVFHYIGHGGYDEDRDEGYLVLSDGNGGSTNLYARDLSRIIRIEKLRLVLLNACEGAMSQTSELFSSTASTLVTDGIPVVMAMQYPITDLAAIQLSRTFYESVADGRPVDYALADARVNIKISQPNSIEWATPVLFMRATDGVLVQAAPPSTDPVPIEEPERLLEPINPEEPEGYDPNNLLAVGKSELKDILEKFTKEELRDMADDLGVDPENLAAQTRNSLARELAGHLNRRNRINLLIAWLNDKGKLQIDAAIGHRGQIKFVK